METPLLDEQPDLPGMFKDVVQTFFVIKNSSGSYTTLIPLADVVYWQDLYDEKLSPMEVEILRLIDRTFTLKYMEKRQKETLPSAKK